LSKYSLLTRSPLVQGKAKDGRKGKESKPLSLPPKIKTGVNPKHVFRMFDRLCYPDVLSQTIEQLQHVHVRRDILMKNKFQFSRSRNMGIDNVKCVM